MRRSTSAIYVIYGPELDQIIHEYRYLTGHTPMLPKWAYGFLQSKDRYVSQDEILGIAHRYREEHIPLDAIVQDWYWWKLEGDPIFNSNFPDVPGELKQLHDQHIHAMLSVWGCSIRNLTIFGSWPLNIWTCPRRTCTTPSIRRLAVSIGITWRASSSLKDGTPSGSTAQSRKNTFRIWETRS